MIDLFRLTLNAYNRPYLYPILISSIQWLIGWYRFEIRNHRWTQSPYRILHCVWYARVQLVHYVLCRRWAHARLHIILCISMRTCIQWNTIHTYICKRNSLSSTLAWRIYEREDTGSWPAVDRVFQCLSTRYRKGSSHISIWRLNARHWKHFSTAL